ncbi:MAG: protoporphyrinogen/coproporphyrinogen oxidase [bacterium]
MEHAIRKTDILVAGAGIAGCAASQAFQAAGADYLLLERNVEPGGLTRSISIGEAQFDYTGHFMHLARCSSPAALPFAHQNDEDWGLINRRSMVFIEGEMVPAPFQYNLFSLPGNIRKQCIDGFHSRSEAIEAQSFREYLHAGFGEGICHHFLFPYNEKIMACPLDELSVDAVKRFFPVPDKKRIESGYRHGEANQDAGYNSRFWYPKHQGIGLLAQGLAKGLKNLITSCPVEGVDLAAHRVSTPSGTVRYERLISSMPLRTLCTLTSHPALRSLADSLRYTRVLCLNLLIQGTMPEIFQESHWIYVPQRDIPFYRLGIYSHIAPGRQPQGMTALYVEVASAHNAPAPVMGTLLDDILSSLERLGWVYRSQCAIMTANWIDCAYVLFDHSRKKTVSEIFGILKEYEVYPIGRYGLWDYISMEDAILSGVETAGMLLT